VHRTSRNIQKLIEAFGHRETITQLAQRFAIQRTTVAELSAEMALNDSSHSVVMAEQAPAPPLLWFSPSLLS
jgi:hypothetical protein